LPIDSRAGLNDRRDMAARSTKTVVEVAWLDAAHQEDDIKEQDIPGLQPVRMVSGGLLLGDDEERITISSHVAIDRSGCSDTEVDYGGTLVIPSESVVARYALGELVVG